MTPLPHVKEVVRLRAPDAVLALNLLRRQFSVAHATEYFEDGGLVEDGRVHKRPPEPRARVTGPPLRSHVGGIVGGRSQENVRWVAARRVVAVVAREQARRDGSVRQHPGDAVRALVAAFPAHNPVPALVEACDPGPALAVRTAFNLFPESTPPSPHGVAVYGASIAGGNSAANAIVARCELVAGGA